MLEPHDCCICFLSQRGTQRVIHALCVVSPADHLWHGRPVQPVPLVCCLLLLFIVRAAPRLLCRIATIIFDYRQVMQHICYADSGDSSTCSKQPGTLFS
jgi:hypothetical protein